MNRRERTKNVVCLIDMDCFYCQVEEKLDPTLQGKPVAVVQYNAFQGGGIIAVNYAARARGVSRHMRGDEAKKHCPEIELVRVPSVREKADLTKYREAGKEVAVVLQKNTSLLERASVDEAYLDITERVEERLELLTKGRFSLSPETLSNTFAVGFDEISDFVNILAENKTAEDEQEERDLFADSDDEEEEMDEETKSSNLRLLIGATIVNEIRTQVKEETGYDCSAGIANNKILAKLACGINKPNKQTVLPLREIPKLFETLPINKIKGLGGKFGEIVCDTLKVKFMGDLLEFTERELQAKFEEKNGSWLYLLCRGIDLEPVTPRYTSKSIGCCKKFPGRNAIKGLGTLTHWMNELATEIGHRIEKDLEENNRRPQLLTVSYMQTMNGEDVSSSRSIPLTAHDVERMANDGLECIKRNTEQFLCATVQGNIHHPIKFLGLSVGKFEKIPSGRNRIQEMFKLAKEKKEKEPMEEDETKIEEATVPKVEEKPKLSFFQRHFKAKEEEKEAKERQYEELQANQPATYFPLNELINVEEPERKPLNERRLKPNRELIFDGAPNFVSASTLLVKDEPKPSYVREYAEFNSQNFNLDDYLKVCPTCNKKVLNFEYDSHQDFHFAMEMSKQQRMEYRKEEEKKLAARLSPRPATQLRKKEKPRPYATITSSQQIVKYLNKDSPDVSLQCSLNTEICPDCGKAIPVDKAQEHSDHHVAKKLQLELQMQERQTMAIVTKTSSPARPKKRKTPSASQGKSIATFFPSS